MARLPADWAKHEIREILIQNTRHFRRECDSDDRYLETFSLVGMGTGDILSKAIGPPWRSKRIEQIKRIIPELTTDERKELLALLK